MSTKITIPIAIIITAIVTTGIMYSIDTEPTTNIISQEPEIIYIDKPVENLFAGTNEIKKISSQEDLQSLLDASNLFSGGFYEDRFLARNMIIYQTTVLQLKLIIIHSPFAKDPSLSHKSIDCGGMLGNWNTNVHSVVVDIETLVHCPK